jgi:hypothetical protein
MKHLPNMLMTSIVTAFLASLSSASLAGGEPVFLLASSAYPPVQQPIANRDILGVKLGMTTNDVAEIMASEGFVGSVTPENQLSAVLSHPNSKSSDDRASIAGHLLLAQVDKPRATELQALDDKMPVATDVQALDDKMPVATDVQALDDKMPVATDVQAFDQAEPRADVAGDVAEQAVGDQEPVMPATFPADTALVTGVMLVDAIHGNLPTVQITVGSGGFDASPPEVDVLGLRLGAQPSQVKAMMEQSGYTSNIVRSTVSSARSVRGVQVAVRGSNEFVRRQVYFRSDADSRETVEVHFVSSLSGNGAFKIDRSITFLRDETKPDGKRFVQTVLDKYGVESRHKSWTKVVSSGGSGMAGYLLGSVGGTRHATYDALTLDWFYIAGEQVEAAEGARDSLQIEVVGKGQTLDNVKIVLENREVDERDRLSAKTLNEQAERMAKNAPRPLGTMPKL